MEEYSLNVCRAEPESELEFKVAKEACRMEAEAPSFPSFSHPPII